MKKNTGKGECSCASFTPNFWFPGPDKSVYILSIRPPCKDCLKPASIIIDWVYPSRLRAHNIDVSLLPRLPFNSLMVGLDEFKMPIIDPDGMAKLAPDYLYNVVGKKVNRVQQFAELLEQEMASTRWVWEAARKKSRKAVVTGISLVRKTRAKKSPLALKPVKGFRLVCEHYRPPSKQKCKPCGKKRCALCALCETCNKGKK